MFHTWWPSYRLGVYVRTNQNQQISVSLHVQEQVLWLDIPVDHLLGVAVGQGSTHLPDVLSAPGLVEPAPGMFRQGLVHLNPGSTLKDEVDPGDYVEVSEQSKNVGKP